MENNSKSKRSQHTSDAVKVLKTAILQSKARAATAINQEQLALYHLVGSYISENTRNNLWGSAVIKAISEGLQGQLPGLHGFSETNLKNMRSFYEAWSEIDLNSSVSTDDLKQTFPFGEFAPAHNPQDGHEATCQGQMTTLNGFPIAPFLSLSFTHHLTILTHAKEWDERLFYIQFAAEHKVSADALERLIKKDLFHHQEAMPHNCETSYHEYKRAYRTIKMFKDESMLDFINVEELGMHDDDGDERVIEPGLVHKIKNFVMTYGTGFSFYGTQIHYDQIGYEHWIALVFYNRDLRRLVVFAMIQDKFKSSYLTKLSSYLFSLSEDDRRKWEEEPIGVIICKSSDKAYVEYVLEDGSKRMGTTTYKASDEMDAELQKVLPPKDELERLLERE